MHRFENSLPTNGSVKGKRNISIALSQLRKSLQRFLWNKHHARVN